MAINYKTGNYVKFLRGTPAAYLALTPKDPDTLYFISEKEAEHGLLYLGDKLISGSLSGALTIEDLSDTLISAGIQAGSLLYYDGNHWIDKSLEDIFEIIIGNMIGATKTEDGEAGLVPAPKAGQDHLYLQGNGTWSDPTTALKPVIQQMGEQLGTLIDNDVDKSVRDIAAEEVQKIVDGAPEAFDTLREIAEYLEDFEYESDLVQRLASLENVINNTKTGLLVRTSKVEVAINEINTKLGDLETTDADLQEQINNLLKQISSLKWQEFTVE